MNKNVETSNETQTPKLDISDVIKSVCEHDWKCISYISPSGVWMCTKCNKTVG
jgi:hypothetical protein